MLYTRKYLYAMLKFISNMSVELNITTKLMKCLLIRLVLLTNMLKIVFILHSCLLHPKSAKVQFVGSFTCTCYIVKRYLILTSILNKLQKDKLNDVMITFKNIAITKRQTGPCTTWYANPCPTKKMKSIINIPCQLVQNDLQI